MRTRLLASALACVCVLACGEGGTSPTAPAAPQPFNQTINGSVSAFGTVEHPLTTPRAGTLTLRLAWAGAADLDLYLTSGACSNPGLNGCMLAAANGFANPETIIRTVASGESLKVWVDSFSESAAGYTLTISIN